MGRSECPISQGEGRKNHTGFIAPFAQEMLTHGYKISELLKDLNARAPIEAPGYSASTERPNKIPLDPLISVLSHQITMDMLSTVTSHPESSPMSGQTDQSILDPSIKALHMLTEVDPQKGSHNAFVRALMERVNPSYESVLAQVMPDTPVWQAFATLCPEWFDSVTTPSLKAYYTTHGGKDPVNPLHTVFWEGACTLPTHAEELAPLIYSDDIKSVGQFQNEALKRGVVRFLAQGTEVSKTARNKITDGGVISEEHIEQDTESGILTHGAPLANGIEKEISKCGAIYGLLDPSQDIRNMCRQHNEHMGHQNRSTSSFRPVLVGVDPLEVVSSAEAMAYFALLVAPSTLWHEYLKSKDVTDWSDALSGTRAPDGSIITEKQEIPVFVRN